MKQREAMVPILPAPDARKQTKHMVLMASVATAKSIVAHADAWAAKLDGKADLTRGAATRKRLAGGEGGSTVAMAVSPTNQLVASIELAAKVHATNHHEVLAWCVNRGIGEVSTEMLEAAFPGRRPSFSLVGVLALKLGLDRIDEFKPSPKAADGSVVGGRATGGKWPKRGVAKKEGKAGKAVASPKL